MSRRRDDDRYSRYDDRELKNQHDRSRSRGRDRSPERKESWESQFMESAGFPPAPPAPSFSIESASFPSSYQSYSGIYDDFPSISSGSIPAAPQPPSIQWNQLMLPPAPEPAATATATALQNFEDEKKKEEAIESEVRNQKATLSKQREEYARKATTLKKELETLKDQRNELRGDSKRSPSPDSKRFLKENAKLQLEIQNKLKTINNVVDMLNGIIGEKIQEPDTKKRDDTMDISPERSTKRKSRSPVAKDKKFNYVYYDPEMHWCRICQEFPPTAKDYLNHLHSQQHHKIAAAHLEAPWHGKPSSNEGLPNYPNAPTKRTPIRGLQFFVPSTAWYCKLCDEWIGDLHCASAHLKSITHSKNYTNFAEQNPHWETDWMSDRQKAFEKSRSNPKVVKQEDNKQFKEEKQHKEDKQYTAHTISFDKDGFTKKKKDKSLSPVVQKEKKKMRKKKRSRSSSSSSSSESEPEPKKEKKVPKRKEADPNDDKMLEQWIECQKLTDKERKMLENIKNSIRSDKNKEREKNTRDRQRERERERERERVTQMKRQDVRDEREKREERGKNKNESSSNLDKKITDVKKMPFIGKMPVFKSLTKPMKPEDHKSDLEQKKDDDIQRKRQEIDAEIQRKVAQFKLKLQTKIEVGPPGVAMPTSLGGSVPAVSAAQQASGTFPQTIHRVQKEPVIVSGPSSVTKPNPMQGPNKTQPATKKQNKGPLHRDFQEALDIIFPEKKQDGHNQQGNEGPPDMMMFQNMGGPPGMPPFGPMGPPFGPPMGMMPPPMNGPPMGPPMNGPPMGPPMNGPPMMMGYDFNGPPLFGPGPPQLYDRQVPMAPGPGGQGSGPTPSQANAASQRQSARQKQKEDKKNEMEDLAMLGIDAADVGACIS